jgi:predicted 2-oxoglutarate/Fe(II)-dependent dioxygenase YbiX|tara:strand:+ start:781 stop:1356 length:576 start_codon:yes stop_codon:yes gene_type:complete
MRFAGEIMIDGIGAKIYIFKNLFSERQLKMIRDGIDEHHHIKETYSNNHNVLANSCDLKDFNNRDEIESITMNALEYIRDYMSKYFGVKSVINKDVIQFRHIYGKTTLHRDGPISDTNLSSKHIRMFSVILGLNDNFKGGELHFPEFDNFRMKVGAGDAIVFPPYWTHVHGTTDLIDGTSRYTINTWFEHG